MMDGWIDGCQGTDDCGGANWSMCSCVWFYMTDFILTKGNFVVNTCGDLMQLDDSQETDVKKSGQHRSSRVQSILTFSP